ncbi:MAG: hypothetical protein PVI43_00430 [Candidatus Bathyarchaeota archaeon]|jgi:hypothetical protein
MGVSLTLVVNAFVKDDNLPLAYERLLTDRDYDMQDSIRNCGVVEFRQGRKLHWYDDEGLEDTDKDNYGDRLTSTRAKLIADAMAKYKLSPKNRAVMEYMKALPPDTEIFLWWH